jgi:hypothetical protein
MKATFRPKRQLTFNGLHGSTSQKTELFITTAVRNLSPSWEDNWWNSSVPWLISLAACEYYYVLKSFSLFTVSFSRSHSLHPEGSGALTVQCLPLEITHFLRWFQLLCLLWVMCSFALPTNHLSKSVLLLARDPTILGLSTVENTALMRILWPRSDDWSSSFSKSCASTRLHGAIIQKITTFTVNHLLRRSFVVW